MRIPLITDTDSRDGSSNKDERLTNMLAEKDSELMACIRPGLISRGNADGNGNGLVCFNGELISVYSANLGYWTRYFDINNNDIFTTYGNGSTGYDATNLGVVVGKVVSGANTYAFRFDPDNGMENLGTLGGTNSEAYTVSDDGLVIAGKANNSSGQYRPFKWTSSGGMVDLGTLGGTSGYANGISGDGTTIVGGAQTAGSVTRAFKWTSSGGMVDLGAGDGSYAEAASYDGSVITGTYLPGGFEHAFKWTSGGGIVDLGTLGGTRSYGRGISGDGTTIVGGAQLGSNYRAFKWTSGGGMVSLGVVSGTESIAYDVSSDGGIIVGIDYNSGTSYYNSFIYESSMILIDLPYMSLAYGCSTNGQIIVGQYPVGGGNMVVAMNQAVETGITTIIPGPYDFAVLP